MKKAILFIASLLMVASGVVKGQNESICRLGFTYMISQSNHWGKGKPIVQNISPYSTAEAAGLRQYDIIESIDGIPVEQIGLDEIPALLNPANQNEVVLTITNVTATKKQVLIRKECKRANAITEDQLAVAFSLYSIESTSEREFLCPFKTTVTADPVDFTRFQTYAFAEIDENNRALETIINENIGAELIKKGLKPNAKKPDFIVETFYFFDKNPNFRGTNRVLLKKEPMYRYNIARGKMETMPFLNASTAESEVEYLLQLGIRFVDQRDIPGRVLWECESNEQLNESYRLDDYARIHVPLMCMQYPYVKYTRNVTFKVNKKMYNYTGISYDIDRLELVADVDRNSPAYAAGIRPNDVIDKIGRHRMNHSAEEFTSAYKRFVSASMKYRDARTQFTDANGFQYCMFWDAFKYPVIADTMQKTDYTAAFSYLYFFEPYVNSSGSNTCTFDVKRGKEKLEVVIRPTIRTEVMVEIQ